MSENENGVNKEEHQPQNCGNAYILDSGMCFNGDISYCRTCIDYKPIILPPPSPGWKGPFIDNWLFIEERIKNLDKNFGKKIDITKDEKND